MKTVKTKNGLRKINLESREIEDINGEMVPYITCGVGSMEGVKYQTFHIESGEGILSDGEVS